ncbi:hypothetical protein [Pseudonocardia sp.]|uniref:hypothetical protein n=1 Tax=Pseudonocardia sp. TaxID=60912 RepID=UPI003D1277CF
MDGLWELIVDLLSRFGVFTLLLIGMALIIRTLRSDLAKQAAEAQARLVAQDEDHARDRTRWRENETWLREEIEDLRRTVDVERRARWEAEDAIRRGPPPRHAADEA